ncbi:MAG: SDR family NAD(P)-dependent oxidoreductase [Agarilytica sp.]
MKAIIIGATSGMGRELAKQMSAEGAIIGATGRRSELLRSLQKELPNTSFIKEMDLDDPIKSTETLKALLSEMGKVDLVVISSGIGTVDRKFLLEDELATVSVNVSGFTAMANTAYHYFADQGCGHIVGISSVAAVRGGPFSSYNASKAYVSSFLEGLSCRAKLQNKNIDVTDIRPGFVDTEMAKGVSPSMCAPVEKAVRQILKAIKKKRRVVYVTKRWRVIAAILLLLPFSLYKKLISK